MGKKVYIDGNFLLKSGVFYGLDFCMYADESFKDATDEHLNSNEDGIYEVTEDGGSMFDTYFVKGGITMYGENGSTIIFFKNEHEHTYAKYKKIKEQITQLLEEAIVPQNCKNYFYQQQYISLFSNLEISSIRERLSTDCIIDTVSVIFRTLFDCRCPIKCLTAPVLRFGSFDKNSCTRFSPMHSTPKAKASVITSGAWFFVTATKVTLSPVSFASLRVCRAACIFPCTIFKLSTNTFSPPL